MLRSSHPRSCSMLGFIFNGVESSNSIDRFRV
jgi:hypothetical protein